FVTKASHRADDRTGRGNPFELVAQVVDVLLDVFGAAFVHPLGPDGPQDLPGGKDPSRRRGQKAQQVVLFGRKADELVAAAHLFGLVINGEVADGQDLMALAWSGAAKDGPDPGLQLLEVKGFGDVIVRSRGKSTHLVRRAVQDR